MSYLINEAASEIIVGFNGSAYAPPVTGGTHSIDTEYYSSGQLDSSTYGFKVNGGSYFCVCDFLGAVGNASNQFFDCKIDEHFGISEGYSVKLASGGTINIDDACYGRADGNFDFITQKVRSDSASYRGGSMLAKQTRLIGVFL